MRLPTLAKSRADAVHVQGVKFVLCTSPSHSAPRAVLERIYEAYADLLKDPFYTPENPIRNETFDGRCRGICS